MPAFRRQQVQNVCGPLLVTLVYEKSTPTNPWPEEAVTGTDTTSTDSTVGNEDGGSLDSVSIVARAELDNTTASAANTSES